MLVDVNAYCQANPTLRYCSTPYSESVSDYQITDIGVLHEVFRGGGNLSTGAHIYGLGAWNFR